MTYNLTNLSPLIETKVVTDATFAVFRRKKVLKEK